MRCIKKYDKLSEKAKNYIIKQKTDYAGEYQYSLLLPNILKDATSSLSYMLGVDKELGQNIYEDFTVSHNLLITGKSGYGKSTFLDSVLLTLAINNDPSDVKFLLIDPKQIDLIHWEQAPHLIAHAIPGNNEECEISKTLNRIKELVNHRLEILRTHECHNFTEYNKNHDSHMERVVVVMDDIDIVIVTHRSETQKVLKLLIESGDKVGINLIVSTDKADFIKKEIPQILAKVTTRISFREGINMASTNLEKPGEAIVDFRNTKDKRAHCPFIKNELVEDTIKILSKRKGDF